MGLEGVIVVVEEDLDGLPACRMSPSKLQASKAAAVRSPTVARWALKRWAGVSALGMGGLLGEEGGG